MADPNAKTKKLWLLVIALFAVVAVIFVLNPTRGEDDARIEAVASEAAIDRDDTLEDYPLQAEPYGDEGEVLLDVPEGEETGALGDEQLAEPAG